MKNFVQPGNVISATAPAGGIKSGEGMLLGSLFGVAATDAVEGAPVELAVTGVFDLPSDGGAIGVGALVYWDSEAKKVSATAGPTLIGVALAAVAAGGLTARVRLNGSAAPAALG